jgi:hypothetical protein
VAGVREQGCEPHHLHSLTFPGGINCDAAITSPGHLLLLLLLLLLLDKLNLSEQLMCITMQQQA